MKRAPLAERFQDKIYMEPNTGCWLWTGSLDSAGYGLIRKSSYGPLLKAHRLSWFFAHGVFPKHCALHKCDTRACVNPDHLFEGTALDNARDCSRKGRFFNSRKTHCPNGHPYSGRNTNGGRVCNTCINAGLRNRRAERKSK